MNKIFNINLGGFPFTIDEDAYLKLNQYIATIRKHFADSEGCEEILEDIETRMAELFHDQLKGNSIVSMRELDAAIAIMGTPEEFGAAPDQDEPMYENASNSERSKKSYRSGRKFFRDTDNKVLGGVASGLAAYFGIEQVLWVRIIIIVLFFTTGFPIIIYPILWIIIPSAKSSADKLSMKGETVNVSSIAKKVEEELMDLTDRITELGKEFGSKKKT